MGYKEYLEAAIVQTDSVTGKEWEVTIIGPKSPADIVIVDGREYLRSLNNRLYALDGLQATIGMWDGAQVYDNHLTQEEFEEKQGMRSPMREWLGALVRPFWDAATKSAKAFFMVADEAAATKFKNAWDLGILKTIGLSIDTKPIVTGEAMVQGIVMPILNGFEEIYSLDVVGRPAAGGSFNRVIAAVTNNDERTNNLMDDEQIKQLVADTVKAVIPETVKAAIAEALADEPATGIQENEEVSPPAQPDPAIIQATQQAQAATQEARIAKCELMLERKLTAAKLNGFEKAVRESFTGKVFEEKELDAMIKNLKEAQASEDPTGRVQESGQQRQTQVEVGLDSNERFEVEFTRIMMGNEKFRELEHAKEGFLVDRVKESKAYKSWVNAGKPQTGYRKLSQLVYDMLGGDPFIDQIRATEASTLATVTKNTVNIMVAADYSQQERWYEQIVTTEEVDTIDDATLARLYGVNTLSVVDKGGAYTELPQADEEETATFVKRGNYIGVPIEDLMLDKLNYFRSIPRRLSNTWYNTLSALTSGVFTVNSATGPVLSDTGALFNATAVSSAGGHANLLTTALAFASYDSVVTAMISQTDQPLGAGRKLTELQMGLSLLIPVNLRATAHQIRNTENQPGTASLAANPYGPGGNQPNIILVPDWTDTNNFALVGDKNRFPAIYHIFPRGGRTPQLFTADNENGGSMFTNDEMRFKVRMMTYRFSATYDCAPVSDFRPLHKSNVA